MDGPTLFAELKKILAALYGEPADARRVASDAGLDLAHIPFDAKAINTWHNLLAVALRSDALPAVLDTALAEYGDNPALVRLWATYRDWVAAGGQLDAPALLTDHNIVVERGDFVARDKVVYGDEIHGDKISIAHVAGNINVGPAPTRLPKALSAKIPRLAPEKIVGRAEDLADVHQRLSDQRQVVLVNGMGGIGKTTLAQVYVAQYWDDYHHVLWLSQSSSDVVNDVVYTEGLVERLGLQAEGQDAKALFVQIMTALQTIADQPNLLVIDNAESALSDLYDYLPAQPQWHILVTSRHALEKFDRKELDFLGEAAALDLFLRHYTLGKIARDEIKSLVQAVDRHTLTIEILAKTAQTQRTAIHDLQQAIANDVRANVYVPHKGEKIDRVTAYLCSIFAVSHLPAQEQWLLQQFTCLPAEFHPYDLLETLVNPAASQNAAIFAETLAALTATGWLLKHPATDSYKMHRIIADVVKKQVAMAVTAVEPLIKRVTARLAVDQSKDNPIDKFPWIPFGQRILELFPGSDLAPIAILQNNLALVLQDLGEYAGAKALLAQAVRSAEKNFGPDHPATAVSYSNLALVLQDLGEYAGAKALLEQAVRSDEKNFGPDHPTTAVRYSNLALVLQDLGDYAGAKALLTQAVAIFEERLGSSHPHTKIVRNNLASLTAQ